MKWQSEEEKQAVLTGYGRGPQIWRTWRGVLLAKTLDTEIAATKSRLYGRERSLQHARLSEASAAREGSRGKGYSSKYFRSVMRESKRSSGLAELRKRDGEITHDGRKIHEELTEHFTEKFAIPAHHDSGISARHADWRRILTDEEVFWESGREKKIPEREIRRLWDAVQLPESIRHQRDLARLEMALLFREAPSLKEFEEAIRTTKKKSAGGMSGTTYAMFSFNITR